MAIVSNKAFSLYFNKDQMRRAMAIAKRDGLVYDQEAPNKLTLYGVSEAERALFVAEVGN